MKNQIRDRRRELGLSQKELAERCGVSRQTVNAIEMISTIRHCHWLFVLRRSCSLRWTSCSYRRNEKSVFLKR